MTTQIRNHLISEEISNFIVDRHARNVSERTIEFYVDIFAIWQKWLIANNFNDMENLTANDIRKYMIELGENHNPGGVHAHWRSIKALFFWFEAENDLESWKNPMRKVAPPKVKANPIPGVPIQDVTALLSTCLSRNFLDLRDKAIIRTLIDTGMRRAEFCNVRIMDLDMETGALKVIGGKGNKDRIVFVSPTTRRDIMRYMRKRHSRDQRDWLWVTVSDVQLRPVGLREVIRRRAVKAHIPVPTPHDFRRTFAVECLRNGIDLVQLMYLMGHTSTTVLQRYLAIQDDDLRVAHERYGPVENSRTRDTSDT